MNIPIFQDGATRRLFEQDGIVSLPLLDTDEIKTLTSFYQNSSFARPDSGFHSTMFINDPGYRREMDAGIRQVISTQLSALLPRLRILFANFIVKEPKAENRVGIHQDWNLTLPEYPSVNVWIPLIDIDERTGLFRALKGSHHTFRNIRFTPYPDNAYKSLEKYILSNSSPFRVKAGEAIIYDGALVHFSDANVSVDKRIAVGAALIPMEAPARHYYRRYPDRKVLELYETDESFYHNFDFSGEPKGVRKIGEISDFYDLPSEEDLIAS